MTIRKSSKTTAVLLMVTASFCFAAMSLCSRLVVGVESIEKAFFRNLFSLIISYNNNYGLRRGSQPRLFPSQSRSC